ncbi:MAG TPA: hypothetical protein VJH71_01520 [Candidatus Paceibacterota bacterium]
MSPEEYFILIIQRHWLTVLIWLICGLIAAKLRFWDFRIFTHLIDLIGLPAAISTPVVIIALGPISTIGVIYKKWKERPQLWGA